MRSDHVHVGDILDLVLTRLAQNARIALCGAISDYSKCPPLELTTVDS